ncbi:MAG: hypothetical protein ACXVH3_33925 [Solirubrobacteraceae bacterium]
MADAATFSTEQFSEPPWVSLAPYDRVLRDEKGYLRLPLGQQLLPSLQLVAFSEAALQRLGNWDGRPRPGWETLVLEMQVRGRHLQEATLRLLRCGYAAAALGPARALFELMLNLYWVYEFRDHPGKLLENLHEHQLFHDRTLRDELERLPGYTGPLPEVPPFADKAEARAARQLWSTGLTGESVFARIKRWTDPEHLNIAEGVSPDEEPFFPEQEAGALARMYALSVSRANLSLHGGMNDYFDRLATFGTVVDKKGSTLHTFTHSTGDPSLAMVGAALMLSHWSYDRWFASRSAT